MSDPNVTLYEQSPSKIKNETTERIDFGRKAGNSNRVYIDYANGRIMINDGTDDRVEIGNLL